MAAASRAALCLLTLATLVLCPSAVSSQSESRDKYFQCPTDWELHGRFCYRFFNIDHSWHNAAELCKRYGSELVMIDSYGQNNLTWSLAAGSVDSGTPAPAAVVVDGGPIDLTANAFADAIIGGGGGGGGGGRRDLGSHYWLGYRTLDDLSTSSLETSAGTLASQYIGYWHLGNPRPELGECVRARLADGDQSWQLATCEQLLPFMCRATACLAGEFHCANGRCVNGAFTCDSEDDCGDMSDESDCQNTKLCHVYQRSSSGTIESPGYPERYPPNTDCRWTMEAPLGHKITVQFSVFDTEKEFDSVQVLSGGSSESAAVSVMTLSGQLQLLPSQLFTTASNFLIVKFRSDATIEKSGFRASWKSEPDICGGHLVTESSPATLTSPDYPQRYPGGLECLHIISTQLGKIITIEVEDLDLEPGADYIRVRDGAGASSQQLSWLTGPAVGSIGSGGSSSDSERRFISSTGNQLYVYVRTDLDDSRRGFRLNYRSGCDAAITAANGTLYSPGFHTPIEQYPANVQCDMLIRRGDRQLLPLSLKFTHLELDSSDFVQVYDGSDSNSLQLHAGAGFSGSEAPQLTLTAQSGAMLVRFVSDPLKTSRGFQATFSSDCPELEPGAGAIGSSRDTIFGTRVVFTCAHGHQFATGKSSIVTECQPGGQWTVTYIPKCQEVYCGPVPQIDNGFAIGASNVTHLGQATYQCYAGFAFPSGQPLETIQCSDEGNWGKLPVCLASQCPPLEEAAFAKKMVLNGGGRSYGTIVRYECDAGYVRSGMPVLFCMSNGTWSGQVPSCSRIKCPALPVIDNGRILEPKEEYYYGDEASVQCYGGFRLQGSAVITCGPDQQFINQPVCQDINECAAAKCELDSTVCSNTPGAYQCHCLPGHRPHLQCRPIRELGLTSGDISPHNIHVSGTETGYNKNLVRVNVDGGWCGASNGARDNWVMVDLSAPTVIHGFRIQPVSRPDRSVAFAKSLRLFYTNNLTDVLHEYRTGSGAPVEFRTAGAGLSVISMPAPIEARYIRLTILDYEVAPCMRIELMGCVRHECVDIDECAANNGGCQQSCHNSVGSFDCQCNIGHQLYTENGTAAFHVAFSETGHRDNDLYRVNKTCVPRQCPAIEDPVNGVLVSTQETFHYGDVITFHCHFGYVMSGAEALECTASGDWNDTVPTCQYAVCDSIVSKPAEGLLIMSASDTNATEDVSNGGGDVITVPFTNNVTVTCAERGRPRRNTLTAGFRQCVYDPRPGSGGGGDYWLSGAAPQCPRVDCGPPPNTPGSRYGPYQDTRFLSSFSFECETTFSLAGSSSSGDSVVRCLDSGVWDFGDLRCEGPVCSDPGRPADGRQIAASYEQGAEVSFTCNKPGYIPFSSVPIKCVRQPECAVIKPLGISDGRIPAAAINSTTQRANYEADKVRLGSSTGWCGVADEPFTYVQVDLLSLHRVKAILLKGVVTNDVVGRPTEIRFFYKRSVAENYVVYFPNFNLTARDPGNYGELAMITLPESVEARFVILGIVQYDRNPCLKFELMGCDVEGAAGGDAAAGGDDGEPLLGFDMGYSVCVDAEPPQFINCPSELIKVSKSDNGQILPVNFTEPLATDNSGLIVRTEVKPTGFEPPLYVFRDMMVEYLAFDFDGNVAICQMNISVPDESAPRITCPKSYVIQLVEQKPTYSVDFTQALGSVQVTDDTDKLEDIKVQFSPERADIAIGDFTNVTVTATDKSGNTASCYYQVAVQATPCVAWDISAPANGAISCDTADSGDGLVCVATCNDGFRFTDGQPTKLYSCTTGQQWQPGARVPGCVSGDTAMAHYDVSAQLRYRSNGAVATDCVLQYQSELEQFYSDLSAVLSARCSQAVNLNMDVRLLAGQARKVAENMVEMEHILRITPEVAQSTLYNLCGLNLGVIFELSVPSTSVVIETLLGVEAIGNRCPPLKALTSNVSRGYTCDQGEVLDSQSADTTTSSSSIPRCLHCPAGTYGDALERVCTPCERGFYQSQPRQPSCSQCPPGTYTHHRGSSSVEDCVPVCGYGTYSLSGLVPCLACPRNSYTGRPPRHGFTQCEQCPGGMLTHAQAASDVSLCRAQCQSGSYSTTGLQPCYQCPRSFFQPIVGASTCFECPSGNTTAIEGATEPSQCIPVQCSSDTCLNGGLCQMLGHEARCYCPAGFTGKRCETDINECLSSPCHNGATCVDQPQGYTCRCADGYSGVNCQLERSDCDRADICPARAMCMNLPGPDNYRCLCREGYTGPQCNVTVDPCVENGNPCANSGQCVALQQGRFQCVCPDGWQGTLCEVNIDDCADRPCLLGAQCTDLTHDFACDCPKGFTGKRCQQKVDLCADSPCENGLCVDRFFAHECVCYDGWKGEACDTNVDECAAEPLPCQNGGTCIDETGDYSCSCVAGYTGKRCQHIVDYCASQPCQHGSTCNNTLQGAHCTCRPGFVGLQCESEIDECTSSPCSPQGTASCQDVDNNFICHCRQGYSGELCQTNMDECASNPCLNEGVCTDGFDAFSCQCKPGWTGERCETDIGSCHSSPCLNDAKCVDLFQGFFCACPSGTDGSRCEVTPERCIGSPCMNGGFCRDFGWGLNCSCPDDYLGVGCQHELDACEAGVCQNGATCVDRGAGYTCHCAAGYTGQHCDTDIVNCLPDSCPAGAECIDLTDSFYCRCPFNLTGEDCRKSITVDYDLYFSDDTKSSSASLYAPFQLHNVTSMSIGLWVQFASRLDIGTFFTLYSVSSLHEPADRRVLVQMNSLGVLVDLFADREPVLLDFNAQIPINDRQWHHLVVTWQNTGKLHLITDLVVAATAQGYGQNRSLPQFGYVTLGAPLTASPSPSSSILPASSSVTSSASSNPSTATSSRYATSQAKAGFHGRLARVNMWSRVLDIRSEIPRQVENCRRAGVLYDGLLLRWSGYSRLQGGVERQGPSGCGQTVCPPGYTEDCRSRARDKTIPRVDFCPGDLWIAAPNGSLAAAWDQPRFSDDTKIDSVTEIAGYSPGQLFSWGSHQITYVARDTSNNSAVCSFTLHVLKEICSPLDDPSGGTQQCSSWGPDGRFRYCTISCDPGLQFSEPVADFYVCGADGVWRPSPDRSARLKYPSCAPAEKAQRVVRIRMNFPSSVFCNNAGKSVLNKRIREALQKLNKNWNFCINSVDGDDCQGLNVAVNCARESRRVRRQSGGGGGGGGDGEYEAVVSLPVQSGVVTNPDTNQATDLQKLIETIILENDELDVRSQLPNVILDPASVQLGSEYFCPEGKVVVGDQCVACAAGTYFERSSATCVKCAPGSYQQQLGQLSCVTCPVIAGRPAVTAAPGARSSDECKERCEPGNRYSEEAGEEGGGGGCVPCGFGQYQSQPGQFACYTCQLGHTTRTEQSVGAEECKPECGDGQQLWLDSSCRACAAGSYRSRGRQPACVLCPEGKTTRADGAVTVADCDIPVCPPGQFLNTSAGDVCSPCGRGTYQPESQQSSCIECPADTTTQQTGASSQSECINPCNNPASGEQQCSAHAFCVIAAQSATTTSSSGSSGSSGADESGLSSFQCRCKVGYRGNGYNCTDLCDNYCENSGVCSRHPHTGQPRCACIGSFTGGQCEEKSKFAYIAGGVSGFVVIAIICVLFIWMICARANKKKQSDTVQKAMTLPPDAASQVNFYYGAPAPYAESIAPSHHSTYAHYYDEEDDAWEMPNFYNDAYVKDNAAAGGAPLHPSAKANSLARSNASIYGAPRQDDLYDRLRKHAYTGKKDKNDTTDDSDDQAR